MAQSVSARLEYLGSLAVENGKKYSTADIATLYPDATSFIMKSKGELEEGKRVLVRVAIDGTPMFSVDYNEITAYDSTRVPSLTYVFDKDCVIVIAKELGAVV